MNRTPEHTRRDFILAGTGLGGGLLLTGFAGATRAAAKPAPNTDEGDVSPAEDLMREHGVLNRILLIYEESWRRLERKRDVDAATLASAAKIVRKFIEDYHAKLEEDHIFPRFEKAGRLVELVKVLREQHQIGHQLTDQITQLATPTAIKDAQGATKLGKSLRQFVRMYRPHESREDTVLFPAIRSLMTAKEYDDLGERFEDKEHELFGAHGFEDIVNEVARLEKSLGLDDLSKFTAKL